MVITPFRSSAHKLPQRIASAIVDPNSYATNAMNRTYRWLRTNNPIGLAEPYGYSPFWVITNHADIVAISRDFSLYSSAHRPITILDKNQEAQVVSASAGSVAVRSLPQLNKPDHDNYRSVIRDEFTQKRTKSRDPAVRSIARQSIRKMAALNGNCDFALELAQHYSLHVIMNLLGLPCCEEARIKRLTRNLLGGANSSTNDNDLETRHLLNEIIPFLNGYTYNRRIAPQDDLISKIANAKIDEKYLSDLDAIAYYMVVAGAGHDTTASALSAALWALARSHLLLKRCQDDHTAIPKLVEEAIRWATPIRHFMRTATRDTDLQGRDIKKGDWLMLCYASANRDSTIFDHPFRFDIDRANSNHLAFGRGPHACIGQHLARLQICILLEELLPRLSSMELSGKPRYFADCFSGGICQLPIKYTIAI